MSIDRLKKKLIKQQKGIYELTLKYDSSTNVYNYQTKSIMILRELSNIDSLLMFRYGNKSKKILKKIKKSIDK